MKSNGENLIIVGGEIDSLTEGFSKLPRMVPSRRLSALLLPFPERESPPYQSKFEIYL